MAIAFSYGGFLPPISRAVSISLYVPYLTLLSNGERTPTLGLKAQSEYEGFLRRDRYRFEHRGRFAAVPTTSSYQLLEKKSSDTNHCRKSAT
jgi:hypothetical protein